MEKTLFYFYLIFSVFILFFPFLILPVISFAAQESKIRLKIKTASGAQYVSLYDLCEQGNLDQSIDPVIQRGKLYFGKHSAVYQIGLKAALVDGKIVKSDSEIQRGNGYEVFIPADIAKQIVEDFFGGDAVFGWSVGGKP